MICESCRIVTPAFKINRSKGIMFSGVMLKSEGYTRVKQGAHSTRQWPSPDHTYTSYWGWFESIYNVANRCTINVKTYHSSRVLPPRFNMNRVPIAPLWEVTGGGKLFCFIMGTPSDALHSFTKRGETRLGLKAASEIVLRGMSHYKSMSWGVMFWIRNYKFSKSFGRLICIGQPFFHQNQV